MNDNKDLKNLSHDTPETPEKQKKACAFFNKPKAVLKTIGTWFARMFMGASRTIEKDEKNKTFVYYKNETIGLKPI